MHMMSCQFFFSKHTQAIRCLFRNKVLKSKKMLTTINFPRISFRYTSNKCACNKQLYKRPVLFFKIIFYGLCCYSCPNYSPFPSSTPAPLTPSGNPHTIVHVHGSCVGSLATHSLYCTCISIVIL